MDKLLRIVISVCLITSTLQTASGQMLREFGALTWQQKDSIISTLYESGLEAVSFPMIDSAYQSEKAREHIRTTPLAIFAMWQGIRLMTLDSLVSSKAYFDEADQLCQSRQATRDSLYPDLLLNLAELHIRGNSREQAGVFLRRAANHLAKSQSGNGNLYLNTLNQVVALESSSGDVDTAEAYSRRALQFAQERFGQTSIQYFQALAGIGQVHQARGDLRRASRTILQAYELAKTHLADDDINKVALGRNAASVHETLGRAEEAEEIYSELIDFFESNSRAQRGTLYPVTLNQVGAFYLNHENFEKAYEYYNKANILFTLRTERTDPNYIISQSNVADLLKWKGQYVEAQQYYEDALQYAPQVFGENSWLAGHLHKSLGELHVSSGDLQKAVIHQERARDIFELARGDLSLEYAQALGALGKTHDAMGSKDLAEENLTAAHDQLVAIYGTDNPIVFASSRQLAEFYSEKDQTQAKRYYLMAGDQLLTTLYTKLEFLLAEERAEYIDSFESFFSNYLDFCLNNPNDASLNRQALEMAGALKTSDFRPDLTTITRSLRNATDSYRQQYSAWQELRVRIIDQQNQTLQQQSLAETELSQNIEEARQIESSLIGALRKGDRFEPELVNRIQQRIDQQTAYLEFYNLETIIDSLSSETEVYAFILSNSGTPKVVRMVDFAGLDSRVIPNTSDYEKLWKPLEQFLEGKTKIIICADNGLDRFPFHLIPIESGEILHDRHSFRYVSPGGILPFGEGVRVDIRNASLTGGALYDLNPEALMKGNQQWGYNIGLHQTSDEKKLLGSEFPRVTASIGEIKAIEVMLSKKKWSTTLSEGSDATESNLKRLMSDNPSGIIHISTHAFKIEPIKMIKYRHPMMSFGLALTGANYIWRGSEVAQEAEDGLLTALEIETIDLSACDLLTLHLYESGESTSTSMLGQAFRIAGAKQVLMNLWQTDPAESKIFLTTFYKNLLKEGVPSKALAKTQAKMRKKLSQETWGAFVLVE
ncbi:MAG: CHAT domain-containing protein [Saprospiraceae bacterium]|nr:CHAT domain-containing protein [Saprospiraceae bacterium]